MDLEALRKEREGWLKWKNIAPLQEAINALPKPKVKQITLGDVIFAELEAEYEKEYGSQIEATARLLMPWRKGPFRLGKLFIDSEWQSQIKYNLLEPYFNLDGKVVGDIGCNNGYYLFRMQSQNPEKLIGFDPSPPYYSQFQFLNLFFDTNIKYELLGVEHLSFYEEPFDTLFCLGVLYHRSDPVSTLKSLRTALNEGGELFLDTFMIEGDGEYCLTPANRYSKMANVYFIPTIDALKGWCYKAGFSEFELLTIKPTDTIEQRKTDWIASQSLDDFLNPNDSSKTIEGYPAPIRAYIRCVR